MATFREGQWVKATDYNTFTYHGTGGIPTHSHDAGQLFLVTGDDGCGNYSVCRVIDGLRVTASYCSGSYFEAVRGRPFLAKDMPCPECSVGILSEKFGRHGKFTGCSLFPTCSFTVKRHGTKGDDDDQPALPLPEAQKGGDAVSAALATLASALSGGVSEDKLRQIVRDEVARQEKAGFTITVSDAPAIKLDGRPHEMLESVMRCALSFSPEMQEDAGLFPNILLTGPAGSGKSRLAADFATAMGLDYADMPCCPAMPLSQFVGSKVPNLSTGEEKYTPSALVRLHRDGGVFVLEEGDNMDDQTGLVLNAFLANRSITLPDGTRQKRSHKFYAFIAMNTLGTGSDHIYSGRNQQDGALLDRFVGAAFYVDYDTSLEKALCPEKEIRDVVYSLRSTVAKLKLRRIVGTRSLLAARRIVKGEGASLDSVKTRLTATWSVTDKQAVGVSC